jgi:AraC-like DNA-binding protein
MSKSKNIPMDDYAPEFHPQDNNSLQIFNGGGEYRIPEHAHPHFELIYILRGCRGLVMNGKTYRAHGGDLMVFRPGEAHSEFSVSKILNYVVMRFRENKLSSASLEFPDTNRIGPIIRLPNRERFTNLFSKMAEEHQHPQSGSELLLGTYLVEFVVLIRRAVEEKLSEKSDSNILPRTRIRTAIESIQENLSRDLNLEKLARNSFMSVSHFSHLFKEEIGESPKSYQIKERIEKAKCLLAESDISAQEIASELGYESPYFFYRQFKQKTGMTTAEYRKRERGE